MARAMMNHRSEEFGRLLAEVLTGLQQIFQTTAPVLPFAASGTGGLEAAVVNVLSPGDRVLALSCGAFGVRFAAVAAAFGAEVIKVDTEWGRGNDPAIVADTLQRHRDIKAVLVTHNETSTGVANDLQAIAKAVSPSGALLLVDAVSSLGALEVRTDAWGLDVVITGSQKALMGPPGAVFLSVSPRAWEAVRSARMPKLYFSFERAREQLSLRGDFTPYTPAIPVLYALQASLPMILKEGLQARFAHHRRLAQATRAGVAALGLDLFPDPRWASNTVTAVRAPATVNLSDLLRRLRTEHGVELAGGQGRLEGQIFRIGHMGYVQGEQILAALAALEDVLAQFGRRTTRGTAAAAAAPYLHAR
jgi:aspartate aminotransferase-like enzyme